MQAVSVPVTLKIRTGVDRSNRNGVEIAEIAQTGGITMLTFMAEHALTNLTARPNTIRYKILLKPWTFLLSLMVTSTQRKAARVLDSTGAHGVMIVRAAQGQLWLPGQIAGILRNGIDNRPCAEARLELAREHCRLLYDFHGAVMGLQNREEACWLVFEAELGDGYLFFKRAFNALTSLDAQEHVL